MRIALGIATFAAVAAAGSAAAMTKQEYREGNSRIEAAYQAERQKCGSRPGHPSALCVARARGERRVAKAELEAAYKPGPRAYYDAAMARAQATYAVAQLECDDRNGDARQACLGEARQARDRARGEARAQLDERRAAKSP